MAEPDEIALFRFQCAGDWARVREVAGELLARDPDVARYHESMGIALQNLDEFAASEKHFKKAIALAPDDCHHYYSTGWMYYRWGRYGPASDYARTAISLEPDESAYWILMGFTSLAQSSPAHALDCAERALNLDPESLDARRLRTTARTQLEGKDRVDPRQQIREFEELLAFAPNDDSTLYSIGTIHLEELNDPRTAEGYFRQCLSLDPRDKNYQKALIACLRRRDLFLRLLWLFFWPCKAILKLINWCWEKKWPLILMLFLFKYIVVVGAAFGVVFGFFFWPVAKAYEYFTIADLHKKMGKLALYKGPLARLHRAPFVLRMLLFSVLMVSFWTLAILALTGEATSKVATSILGGAIGVSVVAFFGLGWILVIRDSIRHRRLARKNKQLESL